MKYRNKEYNKKRNSIIRGIGGAVIVASVIYAGNLLAMADSGPAAVLSAAAVLGSLVIAYFRIKKEEKFTEAAGGYVQLD